MQNADLLTFRQLSQHPDIVEVWNNYHSIPLNETVLMVVFLGFYDHWMPRYLMKRYVKCWFVDISSIISASRHRRSMKQLPFDFLNAVVLMVVFLDFYDHWMLRYLMKRWVAQYRNGKNVNLIDVLSNNLAPNGYRKVKILPFNYHIKRNRIIVFLFFYNY